MGGKWFGLIPIQEVEVRVHIFRWMMSINPHTSEIPWTEHRFYKQVLSGPQRRTNRVVFRKNYKMLPGSIPYLKTSSSAGAAEIVRDTTTL